MFRAAGEHSLRGGFGFQRSTNDALAGYPNGYVFLFWDRTFSFGGTAGRGTYGYYEVQNRGFSGVASAGMTWNDVKVVPVNTVNDGVDALVQGRADVTQHAVNSAKVKEADAAIGLRHLSDDCSPQGEARLRKAVPGYYPRVIKAGTATAVVDDTCVIAYDTYFFAGKSVPDHVVEAALKAAGARAGHQIEVGDETFEWA